MISKLKTTAILAALFFMEGGLHIYWGLSGNLPEDALIPAFFRAHFAEA